MLCSSGCYLFHSYASLFGIGVDTLVWDVHLGQVMRLIVYALLDLNYFGVLSSTLWYNALPLITFSYPSYHTSLMKCNPCMNFCVIEHSLFMYCVTMLDFLVSLVRFDVKHNNKISLWVLSSTSLLQPLFTHMRSGFDKLWLE